MRRYMYKAKLQSLMQTQPNLEWVISRHKLLGLAFLRVTSVAIFQYHRPKLDKPQRISNFGRVGEEAWETQRPKKTLNEANRKNKKFNHSDAVATKLTG